MAVETAQQEETHRLWDQVLLSVKNRLDSPHAFDTWFKPIVPRTVGPQTVELEVPNAFFIDWIHEHHLPSLRRCLTEVLGSEPTIRLTASETRATQSGRPTDSVVSPQLAAVPTVAPQPHRPDSTPSGRGRVDGLLNPRHTFGGFVVGGGNRFTHAACLAVATTMAPTYMRNSPSCSAPGRIG